jgi:hypothetical protein
MILAKVPSENAISRLYQRFWNSDTTIEGIGRQSQLSSKSMRIGNLSWERAGSTDTFLPNVIAVSNPYWFCKEPGYHEELEIPYLGKERASSEYPMKDFFDKGIVVTVASDYSVTMPAMPLEAISDRSDQMRQGRKQGHSFRRKSTGHGRANAPGRYL